MLEKFVFLKILFSFNNFEPSPAASKHAASATEGVPISFKTIFDGFGTLIFDRFFIEKNLIGKLLSLAISIIPFSSFFKSMVANPAIDSLDKLLDSKKVFKDFSINSLLVFLSQPIPIHKVGGCQEFAKLL